MGKAKNDIKLTESVLRDLGFYAQGKDIANHPCYRLKVPNYSYELQIVLGDYPASNPNSGRLFLYRPEMKDAHCISDRKLSKKDKNIKVGHSTKGIDFIQWIEDGHVGGIKYVTFRGQIFPIASYVTTLKRLNDIYTALTRNEPLKLKK